MGTHDVEVLILTSDLDFATDRVCRALSNRGVPFLRLNRERLSNVDLLLDPLARTLACRHAGEEWLVGAKLRTVWWRQGTFDREAGGVARGIQEQLERTQWSAFMRNMMVFDQAAWVNHPASTYLAECKAVQLRRAHELGFDVPATRMTNDPEAAVPDWIGARVAVKSVDTLLLRAGAEQLFGYTTFMDWDDAATDALRAAPMTVQELIDDKIDLRVTVVGERTWCVSVRKGTEGIAGDWRLTPKDLLQMDDWPLPSDVSARCVALTQELGLRFGAIDLAFARGCFWFIEINPTGEWGWLDSPTRPLAEAIADELARCR